jgi:segregation and condensation protein A
MLAAQDIFANLNHANTLKNVVPISRVTIREKIYLITDALRKHASVPFRSLISKDHSRLEIVVTFLAMLELIKRHLVRVSQDGLFGDISLEISEGWDNLDEIETEFGE